MTNSSLTIGQAIDQLINALEPLDKGARRTALLAVCAHLGIQIQETNVAPELPPQNPHHNRAPDKAPIVAPEQTDIRSLKAAKAPTNSIQMACVVAFYLREIAQGDERKDSVNANDLERYFKQASFKLPSRISQTLIDAKAAGYMDSIGRGEYKLNAVGYNLVAHNLPTKKE